MKNTLTILLLLTMLGNAIAQKNKGNNNPIIGSWKFTNQSSKNDFQKIFDTKSNYQSEYFQFEPNHTFRHNFLDKDDKLVKSLKGKWKTDGEKIKIEYSDINYKLSVAYFFIDDNLVLGQNFNHIIFTKDNLEYNVALK